MKSSGNELFYKRGDKYFFLLSSQSRRARKTLLDYIIPTMVFNIVQENVIAHCHSFMYMIWSLKLIIFSPLVDRENLVQFTSYNNRKTKHKRNLTNMELEGKIKQIK